jgi:hypothetical protein
MVSSHISAAVDWTAKCDSAMLMTVESGAQLGNASGAYNTGVIANAEVVCRGIRTTLRPPA